MAAPVGWKVRSDAKSGPIGSTSQIAAGWRAWMLEHQPEGLPLTTDPDPGELDLFASVGLEMETS